MIYVYIYTYIYIQSIVTPKTCPLLGRLYDYINKVHTVQNTAMYNVYMVDSVDQ